MDLKKHAPGIAARLAVTVFLLVSLSGCNSLVTRFLAKSITEDSDPTQHVAHTIASPLRPDVGISVLWIGHATTLIQIHDRVIITDPVFTKTVGLLAKRSIDPGVDPAAITRLDDILISHMHFDHFSYSSLDLLSKKATLCFPAGGIEYVPEFGFARTYPLKPWQSIENDGVRITAVPVQHFGGRYGFDAMMNDAPTWTGYVIEYKGITVFFAGDTGYNPEFFKEIGRRFRVDVALIPIAPVEPREYMSRIHVDPAEALQVFEDVGAKIMIPIHHDTFFQGLEPRLSYAKSTLQKLIAERSLQDRVKILEVGEQIILID
jgi:L-ascorbate metabolism protein UlaG (beta-lactamase superfamily)